MVRDRANITIAIREEVNYLQSNGAIANVVHCDVDLYFQGHTNSGNHIFSICKTVRTSDEDYSSTTFKEVCSNHRMAQLQVLYIATFTYIFNGVIQFWPRDIDQNLIFTVKS